MTSSLYLTLFGQKWHMLISSEFIPLNPSSWHICYYLQVLISEQSELHPGNTHFYIATAKQQYTNSDVSLYEP